MSRRRTRTRLLPWPMSLIEKDVLHELWQLAQNTNRPITRIVKLAIDEHLTRALDQAIPVGRAAESGIGYQADDSVEVPLPAA